jgi:spore cortex biosynthesis protein YabQ
VAFSVSGQTRLFLIALGLGFCIGLLYDAFRFLRKMVKHPYILIQLEDLLFWVAVSLITFYMMLEKNEGEIRAFIIAGAFIGMIFYFLTLSRLLLPLAVTAADFGLKVLSAVLNIILMPVRLILRLAAPPLKTLRLHTRRAARFSRSVLQKGGRYAKIKGAGTIRELKIIFKKI